MSGSGRLVWIFFLLLAVVLSGGCDCGDDDPSTSSGQADDDSDDDASDDDITPDDDATPDDDVTPDDDSTDDDQSPHISDENTLIHYTNDPRFFRDPAFLIPGGGWIRQIDYGKPGHDRTALAISDDGYATIATTRGRQLVLYHHVPLTPFDVWSEERLAQMAGGADLAVDSTGALHVAYSDLWEKSIIYATDRSGDWEFETVDVIGILKREFSLMIWNEVSIFIDTDDNPHLAYNDPTDWSLKYAKRNANGWLVEMLPFSGAVGRTPDLAIDSQGFVHIAFGNVPIEKSEAVYYTNNISGEWEKILVDSPAIPCSMALDDEENISIAYLKVNYSIPLYRSYFTSSEDDFTIKRPIDIAGGGYNSLIIDNSGRHHLAYGHTLNSYEPRELFYATSTDDDWEKETVLPGELTPKPENISIALDGNQLPNISHYSGNLNFTRKESNEWSNYLPSQSATDISSPALAVDDEGALHAAFLEYDELIYATNKSGNWRTEIAADLPYIKYPYVDIAVSSEGIIHIVLNLEDDEENDVIYHFWTENEQWQSEQVALEWLAAFKPVIEIGEDNAPCILALLVGEKDAGLYYLKKTEAGWQEELISSNAGDYYSIKFDDAGVPHVSYSQSGAMLYHAFPSEGIWYNELVDDTDEGVGSNYLSFDRGGVLFIGCQSNTGLLTKLWKKENNVWIREDVGNDFGRNIHLFFDSANLPHIILYNDFAIFMLSKVEDDWITTVIDDSGNFESFSDAIVYDDALYAAYITEGAGYISMYPLTE